MKRLLKFLSSLHQRLQALPVWLKHQLKPRASGWNALQNTGKQPLPQAQLRNATRVFRTMHLCKVQGSPEKQTRRISNTVSEFRTQLTQQFAKSSGSASGFARRQARAVHGSKGDTIVEVMLSMSILAVILTTAYATSTRSLQSGLDSQYRDQALSYAKQQLELVKNADNSQATSVSNYKVARPFCINPSNTQLQEVDTNTNKCPAPVGASSANQNQYSVVDSYTSSTQTFTSTVTWLAANNQQNQVVLFYKAHNSFITTNGAFAPPTSSTITNPPPVGLTFSANPTSVAFNGSSTLSWTTTNALSCSASGAWSGAKSTSGSQSTGALIINSTFNMTCTGLDGVSQVVKSATVTVGAPPGPTLVFTADSTNLPSGGSTTLRWATTNVPSNNCNAGGAWNGPKSSPGSASTGALSAGSYTYTLTCNGFGGTNAAQGSVLITVSSPPPPPSISYFDPSPESTIYTSQGVFRGLWWASSNTTSCTLTNYGNVPVNGSQGITAYPWQTYYLTCYNAAGASTQRSITFSYYSSYATLYQNASFDPAFPGWVRGYSEGAWGTPGDTSALSTQGHVAFYDRQGRCWDFSPGAGSAFYGFVSWYGMPNDDDSWINVGKNCSGY